MLIFRKANIDDVDAIFSLIKHYADKELMLPRTISSLYQRIRDYTVIEETGDIIGVGGLHILWRDLAEICSLAVHPQRKNNGLGLGLVEHLLRECGQLRIERIFALTYVPAFFEKCGFNRVDKDQLPQKVWTECINCPKFPHCDEIALIRSVHLPGPLA